MPVINCPHGMGNPKSCVDCMDEGPVEILRWKQVGGSWTCKHTGLCATCDSVLLPGVHEMLRWEMGDRTVYTHDTCGAPRG